MDIEISADDKPSFEGVVSNNNTEARIVGIDVPFMDLVYFLVKLSIASIPAAIIVSIILTVIGLSMAVLLGGFIGGLNI